MGCKNAYLKKLQMEKEAHGRAVLAWAQLVMKQYCIDTLQITIHEHFGWGADRIDQLTALWVDKTMREFQQAINVDNKDKSCEADYYQERIDRILDKILNGKRPLMPFDERYPMLEKIKY